jgi:hypothetical protein
MTETVKTIAYRFKLKDGRERDFVVRLNHPSLSLVTTPRTEFPSWTKLEFNQCPNCPLKPAESPRCPVAVSLIDLLDLFKDCLSTETAEMTIVSDQREYRKTMGIQFGLSSLMGLYMATSGCPIIDKLRPMVLTHLPFSSLEETVYRSVSMYLVAQLLRHRNGKNADWDLKDLMKVYDDIYTVNRAFIARLHGIAKEDASLNALVNLDCLPGFAKFSLEKKFLKNLEETFHPYLKD